jgi:hypothetical protein
MSSREPFVQLIKIDMEFLSTADLTCQHRLSEQYNKDGSVLIAAARGITGLTFSRQLKTENWLAPACSLMWQRDQSGRRACFHCCHR